MDLAQVANGSPSGAANFESSDANTSMRCGASALTRFSSATLRPVPRIFVAPIASAIIAALRPSIPLMPFTKKVWPGPTLSFFMAA
jgi:hypothetical protein